MLIPAPAPMCRAAGTDHLRPRILLGHARPAPATAGRLQEVGYDDLHVRLSRATANPSHDPPDYTPRQWVSDRDHGRHARGDRVGLRPGWIEHGHQPRAMGIMGVSRGACAAIIGGTLENPDVVAPCSPTEPSALTDTTIEYFMKRWAYIFAKREASCMKTTTPVFWRFLALVDDAFRPA